MTNDTSDLKTELDRITAELDAAESELIRLDARVTGLRAQRESLALALARQQPASTADGEPPPVNLDAIKKRTAAIEELLRQTGRSMSIDEVMEALNLQWRDTSDYAVVASTLNHLEKTGRIAKISRGKYVTLTSTGVAR